MVEFIEINELTKEGWFYYHRNNPLSRRPIRFTLDGSIELYSNPNEVRWEYVNKELVLLSFEDKLTVKFTHVENNEGYITLSGQHIPNPETWLCLSNMKIPLRRRWGTKDHFLTEIEKLGWSIGDHTYGVPRIIPDVDIVLSIGKYTSIAEGVEISFGNHRTDMVSSYPFSTLSEYWPSVPHGLEDHISKGDISIGNDVWIGSGAFIFSGVTIGDGAVIGARSIITKNVPPYAIVGGTPAKVIKYRFEPHIIGELMQINWWSWPDEVVDSYLPLIMSNDIVTFINAVKADKNL